MDFLGIIQARFNSSRLPGKVLRTIGGKALLGHVIERVQLSKYLDHVVVATSDQPSDDPIVAFCEAQQVTCTRGSLANVTERIANVLTQFQPHYFVRICADSPFYDANILDHAIQVMRAENYDIVTNVLRRSFPRGQSVEVIRTQAFLSSLAQIKELEDQEHVTQYFYRHAGNYKIHNIEAAKDYSQVNMCVDSSADLNCAEQVMLALETPLESYGWEELLKFYA